MTAAGEQTSTTSSAPPAWTVVLPIWAVLTFWSTTDSLLVLLQSAASYFFAIAAVFAVARLAVARSAVGLWFGLAAALVLAYLVGGHEHPWMTLTGLCAVFLGGTITGRMAASGRRTSQVYMIGLAVVGVIGIAQLAPLWFEMIEHAAEVSELAKEQMEQLMASMGQSELQIRENIDTLGRVYDLVARLVPATTLMSLLLQYTLGFLLFAHMAVVRGWAPSWGVAFDRWRMPFGVVPVVIVAVALRLMGGQTPTLIADNVVAILAVFYCATGLSLTAYLMNRFRFSTGMKIAVYAVLFLTQVVGFFIAALLGLADSFFDWRTRLENREPS